MWGSVWLGRSRALEYVLVLDVALGYDEREKEEWYGGEGQGSEGRRIYQEVVV